MLLKLINKTVIHICNKIKILLILLILIPMELQVNLFLMQLNLLKIMDYYLLLQQMD